MKNKAALHTILKMGALLLIAIVVGTIAMIVAYALPTNGIRRHVYQSISNYEEGDHPEWANGNISTQQDCFTDSLILNTAVFKGTGNVINDAMQNYYMQFYGHEITDSLPVALDDNVYDSDAQIAYARYWHGHLAILKPLLALFKTSDVLTINMMVQLVLLLFVAVKMYVNYGFRRLLAFVLPLLILNPVTIAQSFQYTQVYIVVLLHMAVMVNWKKSMEMPYALFFFMLNGILTAYLDLLTYPAVAMGIPLIFFLSTQKGNKMILKTIKAGVSWAVGFGGMWAGKWIVCSILTGQDVLQNVREMMGKWTSGGGDISYNEVLRLNFIPIQEGSIVVFTIATVLMAAFVLIRKRVNFQIDITKTVLILLIGVIPFVWYFLMRTHSYVHYWMTFRNLAITGYAVYAAATELLIGKREQERLVHENG